MTTKLKLKNMMKLPYEIMDLIADYIYIDPYIKKQKANFKKVLNTLNNINSSIRYVLPSTARYCWGVGGIVRSSYEYNDEYDDEYDDEYYVHAPIYESYDPNIYTRLLSI